MRKRVDSWDDMELKALINKHSLEPGVSIDEYVRNRKIGLGKRVTQRKRIYLDTRYWVILVEVFLGRLLDPLCVRLLDYLRSQARNHEIICPISESVFIEILKQQDLRTRRKTAEIIDELSLGVILASEPTRIGIEIAHYFYSQDKRNFLYPLKWIVWSKLSHVFGDMYPSNTGLAPNLELIMQKVMFDHIWKQSLTEIVDMIGDNSVPLYDFQDLAFEANETLSKVSDKFQSYRQIFKQELAGSLSSYFPIAEKILEDIFKRGGYIMPVQPSRKAGIAKLSPTLHIHTLCHAAIRWDKKRKLKGNDFYDFHHAAAAIPYCDVFLTEHPLQVILEANHLKINHDFDCKIISSVSEAVAVLGKE